MGRELTAFEEILREDSVLRSEMSAKPRGEYTIAIAGADGADD